MSDQRSPADRPESLDDGEPASDESPQSDAEKAAEIADEKERSGAETVV